MRNCVTMTKGLSSLYILPRDPLPQSCLPSTQASWLPPPLPQSSQTLSASSSYSWHCPTYQEDLQPCLQPSSPSLSSCLPTHTHTSQQAFTPCFTPPAQFRVSCHLPNANLPPSDRFYQENKANILGVRFGRSA